MDNTKIQWADATFNPWWGCTKVAAGCASCYAASFSKRTGRAKWGPDGTRVKTSEAYWRQPLKWNREAEKSGERRRVFCASMADVFEEWEGPVLDHHGRTLYTCPACFNVDHDQQDGEGHWEQGTVDVEGYSRWLLACSFCGCRNPMKESTATDIRRDLFALIDRTQTLDWLLLTKRPENIGRMWVSRIELQTDLNEIEFRPNVWLGTSISDQDTADRNVPLLLKSSGLSPVRFLSCEPLLGPIDLIRAMPVCDECNGEREITDPSHCLHWSNSGDAEGEDWCPVCTDVGTPRIYDLNWVIIGCESGGKRRPMQLDWARRLVDQCRAAGVACFVKQIPINGRVSHEPEEWPADLRVREWPVTVEIAT